MAVVGDQAYLLVRPYYDVSESQADNSEPAEDVRMVVYVLDLRAWHWTQLPPHSAAPLLAACPCPVVVQVGY